MESAFYIEKCNHINIVANAWTIKDCNNHQSPIYLLKWNNIWFIVGFCINFSVIQIIKLKKQEKILIYDDLIAVFVCVYIFDRIVSQRVQSVFL